jgi:SSS family solute:Na+ symporter
MFIVGVTGWSATSLALPAVMIFLSVLVLVYTCLGGMISVVINDYVQCVALSFGLLFASVLAIWKLGWNRIFETVEQVMGPNGFDPTIAESGFGWEYIVWMGFLGLVGCAIWPTAVARALSMENAKAVKRLYMFASLSYLIRFLIPYFWGICAFVYIWTTPSLKEAFFPAGYPPPQALPGGAVPVDNLFATPIFLGQLLPAGALGIITAGMVAAFMGTQDSYLLCWGSVLTQDVVAPIYESKNRMLTTQARITLTRVFIVLISVYLIYWGVVYGGKDDVWDYMAVTGAIYSSGAFAVLLGGLYWRRASSTGAFLSLIAGLSALLGLDPVQNAVGIDVPSARVGLCSIAFTVLVMVLGSLTFPDRPPRGDGRTH